MKTISSRENRIGAGAAVAGSGLLFAGTYLHPMAADPNDAVAAFTEYAADSLWVASHLTQLAGMILIVTALLLLAHRLDTGWTRVAAGGAIASLALAGALQAVDGVALKVMVDAWAAATGPQKAAAFHAAFAVRQVEIGLASMLCLLLGLTATAYGAALLAGRAYPKWVGALAVLGGLSTAAAGVVIAHTGFSELAMAINMPANAVLLAWMIGLGACMWRRP